MVLSTAQVPNQSVRTLLKMLIDMTEKEQARCPACGYCIMQSTESSIEKVVAFDNSFWGAFELKSALHDCMMA